MSEEDREASNRGSQNDGKLEDAAGSGEKKPHPDHLPPAGPHARPDLMDEDKTPGTGMLPEPGDSNPSPTG